MSKKSRIKKEVGAAIEKWRPKLFLGEWYFDVLYPPQPHPDSHMIDAMASISVNHVYMQAEISIYPGFFRAPADVREFAIVHELCHCHTQPMWNMATNLLDGQLITHKQSQEECERLTQRIANIAFWGKQCQRKFK